MFCTKCGANIPDNSAFCAACGQPLSPTPNAAAQQQPQYQQPQYQQPQQPQYQQPQYQQPQYQQPYNAAPVAPAQGMGWFKFLIYFALFAGAVLNVINGIMAMTGAQYGDGYAADLVYAFFDGLQALDIIFGLGCLVLAAFQIYVRFSLAGFKRNGPKMLIAMYVAVTILNLVYLIGAIAIIGTAEILSAAMIGSLVGSGVMVAVNSVYFKKRTHLFVR